MTQFFWGGQRHTDLGALCIVPRPVVSDFVPLRGGWSHTQLGEAYIEEVTASTLPAGAVVRNGMAWTSDGALCVTFSLPVGSDCRLGGWRVREDGVACLTTDTPTAASRYQGAAAYNQQGQRHVGNDFSFYAGYQAGSIIARTGQAATFTRATVATVTDHDLMVRVARSGEARFQGLRRVENILQATAASGTWSVDPSSTLSGPDSNGWFTLTKNAAAIAFAGDIVFNATAPAFNLGRTFCASLEVKDVSGDMSLGVSDITLTTTSVNFPALRSPARRMTVSVSNLANTGTVGIVLNVNTAATTGVLKFRNPQLEILDGQAVPVPGEFTSVGVLASPYQGANVDGVQYVASHNGNVVQQNLLLQSQAYETASWTKTNITITADAATAPDGSLTADKVAVTATNTALMIQTLSAPSKAFNYSLYVKQGSGPIDGNTFALYNNTTALDLIGLAFNYQTGALSLSVGAGTYSATFVGNGWWRISITITSGVTAGDNIQAYIGYSGGVETAGEYLYAWGAQLQLGRRAGTYVPTVAAAINNGIVEEAAGDALSAVTPTGYLSEDVKINLALRSEQFGSAPWAPTNITITADNIAGPSGVATADKIAATANAVTILKQSALIATGTVITYSIYVKQGSGATDANAFAVVNDTSATTVWQGTFNYSTGLFTTVGGAAALSADVLAGGWYRLKITVSAGIAATNSLSAYACFVGNAETAGEFAYAWGAQFENAAFASTYISTVAAAVTRNADTLVYNWSGLPLTTGTQYSELYTGRTPISPAAVFVGFNATSYPLYITIGKAATFIDMSDGTSGIETGALSDMATGQRKKASTWGGATMLITGDGGAVVSGAFDGAMGAGTTLAVGTSGSVDQPSTVFGKTFTLGRKLTSVQLQALTA